MTKPTIEEWIEEVQEHAAVHYRGPTYIRLVKCCAIIEHLMVATNFYSNKKHIDGYDILDQGEAAREALEKCQKEIEG